jgi:protein-L-isoaspartate O-methyltransferase
MPELGPRDHEDASQRAEFQLFLRQHGIRSNDVLRAMETVPRSLFVPTELVPHAYAWS